MTPPETITVHGYSEIRDCSKDEPLTKRERFAMAAMQGLCANPRYLQFSEHDFAKMARIAADAAIAGLEAHPEP